MAKAVTGIDNFTIFLSYKNDINFLSNSIPLFYKQILAYWYELASRPPETGDKMINEIIWNNKRILVGNNPIFWENWVHSGIQPTGDLLRERAIFMTLHELNNKYETEFNTMQYNSLRASIPKDYIKAINQETMQKSTQSDSISIKIGTNYKEVKSLKCRNFYAEFVSLKFAVPTAIYKWEELYYLANKNGNIYLNCHI